MSRRHLRQVARLRFERGRSRVFFVTVWRWVRPGAAIWSAAEAALFRGGE